MFRIGEFSKISQVPVKTLRYYDEIDLFKPGHVDDFTGYRYYSMAQLPRLNRILALKDLGFPLEQIAGILDGGLNAEQLRGMLRLRQAELQQQIEVVHDRLLRVAMRLKHIEQEGKMSEVEVILKKVEPTTILAAREVVPDPKLMRERCLALKAEVEKGLKAGTKQKGYWMALYHHNDSQGIDVEMAVEVEPNPKAETGKATIHDLPTVETMASGVYHGSYDDFTAVGQYYTDIGNWIEANGYRIAGPIREIYLHAPELGIKDPSGVMEIQFPVEKANSGR